MLYYMLRMQRQEFGKKQRVFGQLRETFQANIRFCVRLHQSSYMSNDVHVCVFVRVSCLNAGCVRLRIGLRNV